MKALLTICLLCLMLFASNAQTGVRVGVGASDIAFLEGGQTPYLGYEVNSLTHKVPLVAYQLGITRDWSISTRFSLMTELLWSRKGLSYDTEYLYGDLQYRLILHYLELPVLLKYRTNLNKNKASGIFFGPYLGLLIDDKLKRNVTGSYQVEHGSVNRWDAGVILGYQADFSIKNLGFFWDIRTGYSLKNMMQRVEHGILSNEQPDRAYARNVVIMLSFGYRFPAKNKPKAP